MNSVSIISNEPQKRIYTKLKFTASDKTNATVGFVSQNSKTGEIRGVRQDDPHPKKICVVDRKLSCDILHNTLYNVTLIPMKDKDGYLVIEATPVQFRAVIETTYVPKAIYHIDVKFGNKKLQFDPKDGRKESVKRLDLCRRVLETRVDVRDLPQVMEDFDIAVRNLLRKYENDGFIYRN